MIGWLLKRRNLKLIEVMRDARTLLVLPGNDFSWSSWKDATEALSEIDAIIGALKVGRRPKLTLQVLFAPTGPIQEVSLSSGWARDFLKLAERFDRAMYGW